MGKPQYSRAAIVDKPTDYAEIWALNDPNHKISGLFLRLSDAILEAGNESLFYALVPSAHQSPSAGPNLTFAQLVPIPEDLFLSVPFASRGRLGYLVGPKALLKGLQLLQERLLVPFVDEADEAWAWLMETVGQLIAAGLVKGCLED